MSSECQGWESMATVPTESLSGGCVRSSTGKVRPPLHSYGQRITKARGVRGKHSLAQTLTPIPAGRGVHGRACFLVCSTRMNPQPHGICVRIKRPGTYSCVRHTEDCHLVDASALAPAEGTEGTSPLSSVMCAFHTDREFTAHHLPCDSNFSMSQLTCEIAFSPQVSVRSAETRRAPLCRQKCEIQAHTVPGKHQILQDRWGGEARLVPAWCSSSRSMD